MATNPTHSKDVPNELSEIKRKLAWRMGIAGLMIVALLGGLALFDSLSAPSETEVGTAPQFTEPVPVAKKTVTQPVTPAEPTDGMAQTEKNEPVPESSAAPLDKSVALVEPPPRPEVAAQPALPRASQPSATAAVAPVSPAKAVAEKKPAVVATTPARTETPAAATPSPATTSPAQSRLFSGFALQAGVFSDPRRAEELHAKLMLEGIPSSIEARVEVGPFKNRAEADAAREKLKSMGIDTVLLLPKGAKR